MAKQDRIQQIVKLLSQEGERIVNEQLVKKQYMHRTFNLHDSYGWGVYVNGKLAAKGFPAQKATKGKKWDGEEYKGRETITGFLENKYKPHDGIDLVVAVAMPYGVEVEEIYKYEVVATARAEVKQLESKYPRAKYGVISKGVY